MWEYRYKPQKKEPIRFYVPPDADTVHALASAALAWSYHRAMSLRSELGESNIGLAFLWLKGWAFSFAPGEVLPDVEGHEWWEYMKFWTPWSEGNVYELSDALSFALRLGEGQRRLGFVLC